MYDEAKKAAEVIRGKCGGAEVGLILGSGLADSIHLENETVIGYGEIPGFLTSTAIGHKSEWVSGILGGKTVCLMRGRFHFYEGYDPEDIVFPIRVMKLLGVETVILTNAAGGVNTDYQPGDLVLISDHINFGGRNPLIGANDERFGPRFPDMSDLYSGELRAIARASAEKLGISVHEGVYIWFSGPSYETPAEIRAARILGADVVGMSTVPEAIAARHCGIRVLGISCVTNMAAGILDQPLSHKEVMETGERVREDFAKLISEIVREM